MKKIRLIIYSLLISSFLSCNNNESYKYEKGLKLYMKKNFNQESLNGNYYFLYLDECDTCLGDDLNLKLLNNEDFKDLTLIIVGNPIDELQSKTINSINKKYNVLRDPAKKIFSYETGFFKPILTRFKKNDMLFYKEINDYDIQNIKEYLN